MGGWEDCEYELQERLLHPRRATFVKGGARGGYCKVVALDTFLVYKGV